MPLPDSRWDFARWLLVAATLAAFVLYAPGLQGPFLFDDPANLAVLRAWYNGQADWRTVVLGQGGLIEARPLSMLSFLATVAAGGPGPLSYKAGNLLLHAACAALGFRLLSRTLAQDPRLAPQARALAAIAVALWLLHPIQVSTVLYAVQRMAQLSALFALGAVLAYFLARTRLTSRARDRTAIALLFAAFPLLVVAGVLSKQNAIVAPLLCLAFELAYFPGKRPLAIRLFFGLFLALPFVVALLAFAAAPQTLLRGYSDWGFSPDQRLLTQTRVLMDYAGSLLWPRGEHMSLFRDDFVISVGLFAPATTALAIAGLLALSALVVELRRRAPSLFAGWFFFLLAHSVESSVLPLEMYYEHRNYLPAFGLALALVGTLALWPRRGAAGLRLAPLAWFATAACLVLALQTYGRVQTWRSKPAIVANALIHHPESLRARQTQAFIDLAEGRTDAALAQMHRLQRSAQPRTRLLARIDAVSIACLAGRPADPSELTRALTDAQAKVTLDEVLVVDLLAQASAGDRCPGVASPQVSALVLGLLRAAPTQDPAAHPRRQLHLIAALVLARSQDWAGAQAQAEGAWTTQAPLEVADVLVQAYLANGRRQDAERVLRQIQARTRPYDRAGQALIAQLRGRIQTH
ncbi:hypothetical protein DX914_12225 [Lysobacter silvisoli]|uniref:Tetratricopeptide repeat protein n=2 Tax=Lysobacter silvisoli TaxID=2293254 RepID=A0A371JZI9_9GAMM|nr:hypothetical protein DX914_12225 [Lysobacter silvisoli]